MHSLDEGGQVQTQSVSSKCTLGTVVQAAPRGAGQPHVQVSKSTTYGALQPGGASMHLHLSVSQTQSQASSLQTRPSLALASQRGLSVSTGQWQLQWLGAPAAPLTWLFERQAGGLVGQMQVQLVSSYTSSPEQSSCPWAMFSGQPQEQSSSMGLLLT